MKHEYHEGEKAWRRIELPNHFLDAGVFFGFFSGFVSSAAFTASSNLMGM
jgi:hypothetical protein